MPYYYSLGPLLVTRQDQETEESDNVATSLCRVEPTNTATSEDEHSHLMSARLKALISELEAQYVELEGTADSYDKCSSTCLDRSVNVFPEYQPNLSLFQMIIGTRG